jgi:tellurite resistance-related uncharacterized protein
MVVTAHARFPEAELCSLKLPRKSKRHRSDGFIFKSTPPPEGPLPYKCTPVFDENTLPAGLPKEHRTKLGVWGVIRVLDGRLRYQVLDPVSETILDPDRPGLVLPDQPHFVEPLGPMRMLVEFYDRMPAHAAR